MSKKISMKAVGYRDSGGISVLQDITIPIPSLEANDLLVQVEAVSMNPVDAKQRRNAGPVSGDYRILGFDAAGKVVQVGERVTEFAPGDRVYYAGAVNRPGSNAEFQCVDQRLVAKMPENIDWPQAAALPLTTLTAWEALFERLCIGKPVPDASQSILVVGGAGGVGSASIQLLRALTNLTIICTASKEVSRQWCLEMGAHHMIDHRLPLAPQVDELGIGQPGFVFSTTHTDSHFAQLAELIAPQGRICVIDDPQNLDILLLKRKSVSLHFEFMFTRTVYQTQDMFEQGKILQKLSELIEQGKVKSTLAQLMTPISAESLRKAHRLIETGSTMGKIVLQRAAEKG